VGGGLDAVSFGNVLHVSNPLGVSEGSRGEFVEVWLNPPQPAFARALRSPAQRLPYSRSSSSAVSSLHSLAPLRTAPVIPPAATSATAVRMAGVVPAISCGSAERRTKWSRREVEVSLSKRLRTFTAVAGEALRA